MKDRLTEGALYSRRELLTYDAHQSDRGGVSGNRFDGCDAIVVTRVSPDLCEVDEYRYLSYYSNPVQRSGALFRSYADTKPIRVFRSSKGNSLYSPKIDGKGCKYRFDGVYYVVCAKNDNGGILDRKSKGGDARLFFLVRSEPWHKVESVHSLFPFDPSLWEFFNTKRAEDIDGGVGEFVPDDFFRWLSLMPKQ